MSDDTFNANVVAPPPERDVRLLRAVMEAAGEAVIITSAELDLPGPEIRYVNCAFTRMTGYLPGEVIGQTPRMLQGRGTERAVLDRMRSELATTEHFSGEAMNYRKDGTAYVIDWLITGVRDEHGQLAYWISVQRDVTERKAMEEHQAVLLAELQHRVRNNLAVIRSIAQRTAATSDSVDDFVMHVDDRLGAIASVQTLVTQDPSASIDLSLLISDVFLSHAAREGNQLLTSGPAVRLWPRTAELLGLALHELAANAVKYGALATPAGHVGVTWHVEEDETKPRLVIQWVETGVGVVSAAPRRRGFGTALLERTLPNQLSAETTMKFTPGGVVCTIQLPLTKQLVRVG